jgi:hypothetical protein
MVPSMDLWRMRLLLRPPPQQATPHTPNKTPSDSKQGFLAARSHQEEVGAHPFYAVWRGWNNAREGKFKVSRIREIKIANSSLNLPVAKDFQTAWEESLAKARVNE